MLQWPKRLLITIIISLILIGGLSPLSVSGEVSSCSAGISTNSITPNTTTTVTITVTNTSSSPINWIRITRPSQDFTLNGASADYWSTSGSNQDSSILTSSTPLNPSGSLSISVGIITANVQAPATDWSVDVSDNGGSTNTSCSGSLGMAIEGQAPDSSPPNISNISVTNLATTQVTVKWDTDEPSNSTVNYGQTDSYGSSTETDSNLVTSHSVDLAGLAADTGYHYQVVSRDEAGNEALSGDNTFLTPLTDLSPSESAPVSTKVPLKNTPTEKIPPAIKLTTNFSKPFRTAPEIAGEATDNEALAGIEYSTDGGQNWLPVDKDAGLGTKQAIFSFTPAATEDGNYTVLARAIDTSANIGRSKPATMVIDRLPPLVGGTVISVGPQILLPNERGVTKTSVGIDQKITTSAVGGPTSINLAVSVLCMEPPCKDTTKSFSLTRSTDTGLWSGIMSFERPGTYTLIANSVDGAGNKTARSINTIYVSEPAKIVSQTSSKPVSANITLYYLEPKNNEWVVWDGASYGQKNPQTSNDQGQFNLLSPAGKYYLKAAAEDYKTLQSNIFEIKEPTVVSAVLKMKPTGGLNLGPIHLGWPDFSTKKIDLNINTGEVMEETGNNLTGKSLPSFSLIDTNTKTVNFADLFGKPTLLSLTSTWSPATAEQLSALTELQKSKDLNIVVVSLQENAAKLRAYNAIAGYDLVWLADPDSTLANNFSVQNLPTHYLLDRKGIVQKVVPGVLSKQEILNTLSGL